MSDVAPSLSEWRQNPKKVAWAAAVFATPEWRELNQIMQESEHVRLFASDVDANQQLGQIHGWDLYNSKLKTAASPLTALGEMPEATFLPPEPPKAPEEQGEDTPVKRKK